MRYAATIAALLMMVLIGCGGDVAQSSADSTSEPDTTEVDTGFDFDTDQPDAVQDGDTGDTGSDSDTSLDAGEDADTEVEPDSTDDTDADAGEEPDSSGDTGEDTDTCEKQDFYLDSDGDGYGDLATVESSCTQPEGYVENPDDCDDNDPNLNPDADEVCDGLDNNCDGQVDEGLASSRLRRNSNPEQFRSLSRSAGLVRL